MQSAAACATPPAPTVITKPPPRAAGRASGGRMLTPPRLIGRGGDPSDQRFLLAAVDLDHRPLRIRPIRPSGMLRGAKVSAYSPDFHVAGHRINETGPALGTDRPGIDRDKAEIVLAALRSERKGSGCGNVEYLLEDSPSLGDELGPMIESPKPRVGQSATASSYGETVKKLPLPSHTKDQVLGDLVRGGPLSPRAGRGRSLGRANYPRCLRKKLATGSNDAAVERFSLST
jgi:hypothetical protein